MFFPSESELFFGCGLQEDIRMTNLDFKEILPKITRKSFRVMRYGDLNDNSLEYYNIILYHYPGFVGHWTLFTIDDNKKRMYFFDPYGKDVDTQWHNLKGYSTFEKGYTTLSNIVFKYKEKGYSYSSNVYNIQGDLIENCISKRCAIIAENECGEIICYRIIHKDLSDLQFHKLCLSVGATKIFNTISLIQKI